MIDNAVAAGAATMLRASDSGQNKLVNGTISIAFLKDPNDPQWTADAAMKLYRKILTRYAPGATVDDSLHVYGMAAAWTAVEALRRAGKNLTRESLVKELDTFTASGNPFLLPGIAVKTAGQGSLPDRADAAAALAEAPRGSRSAASGATARPDRAPLEHHLPVARPPAPTARLCFTLRREETARRQPVTDGTPRLRDPQRAP